MTVHLFRVLSGFFFLKDIEQVATKDYISLVLLLKPCTFKQKQAATFVLTEGGNLPAVIFY